MLDVKLLREDLDTEELRPIIAALRAIFYRNTISDHALRSTSS